MKSNYLPAPGKVAWQGNLPFIRLIACLLLILSVLKTAFYQYNHVYLSDGPLSGASLLKMIKWSIITDLFILFVVNTPMLLLLQAARLIPEKISTWIIIPFFTVLNSLALLLNLADVFYYPFHFQRANADLLYSLDHPIRQLFQQHIWLIIVILAALVLIFFVCWKLIERFYRSFTRGKRAGLLSLAFAILLILVFFLRSSIAPRMIPAYPLIELKSNQLQVTQNSFHTFLYSLFRKQQDVELRTYLDEAESDSMLLLRKKNPVSNPESGRKNIVLFIMESVPYDFFDTASPYKVQMPFLDSLLEKSTFYSRAFCYAHQSTRGITAILAGIPTLSDVPLYHSAYVNLPKTAVAATLKKSGFHSFFCIGDDYDNFGFAKCANWLGFDNYFSKEDIPGFRQLPRHTMGIQDGPVLDFFRKKITETGSPFLAVNYNISTHYPYDLPAGFGKDLPAAYTDPMKSMRYYDQSLGRFFADASKEPWFNNTIFLFCSDHWLVPDDRHTKFNAISGYRIPIILYDPMRPEKKNITAPVSQFDVMGTILSYGGYRDSLISYGESLRQPIDPGRIVFSRANALLYHAIDSSWILGFNINNSKVEFLYQYIEDPALTHNRLNDPVAATEQKRLTMAMQAFLQKAGDHYNGKPFK